MAKKSKSKKNELEVSVDKIIDELKVEAPALDLDADMERALAEGDVSPREEETLVETVIDETVFEEFEASEEIAAEVTSETTVEVASEDAPADEKKKNKITDLGEIEQAVEALIFAAPKAMSHQRLRAILAANHYDTSCLPDVLKSIEHAFAERGFNLIKVAGGYQFRSHPRNADILEKLNEDKPQRLSASALEVLAIVSYKQPVTRAEIDAIRGIDSGHLLRGLLEKNMVRTTGHAETTGRPLLYATTAYFLEIFSLNSLDDLPALEEFQRELVEKTEGEEGNDASMQALNAALLSADPNFIGDNSSLAASPDRGKFDEPAEDRYDIADFGLMEKTDDEGATDAPQSAPEAEA